jgi:FKBP-type peptidyl-prolyl cis-trans isomerase SlyD
MIVEEHSIITIAYELRDPDNNGELMERMDANYPFHFLFGAGKLLPAFEDRLYGLKVGDTFDFTLSPQQGYGPVEQGNIIDVSKEAFKIDGSIPPNMIIEGNYVELIDDEGMSHHGKILSFTASDVKVDFNHSMAGKRLHFKGVVLNIRKATIDELVRKHYIQEDGIHRPDFGEGMY